MPKRLLSRPLTLVRRMPKQRFMALFLAFEILLGVILPIPVAAIAERELKRNYPGPLPIQTADQKAASDAKPIDGSPTSAGAPLGEALQGVDSDTQPKRGELTEKRTATSSVSVNNDGTLTEKRFFTPKHFKKEGKWEKIDTRLIEDKNAGDSGNIAGEAWGDVRSWFSEETTFAVKDNDWQARFAPSDSEAGLMRIKKGSTQVGFAAIDAKKGVNPVITNSEDGQQTVRYPELWPGVDVEYIVESAAVKENIILKDKDAASRVSFKILGADVEKRTEKQKAGNHEVTVESYQLKGVLNDDFAIAPANLILNEFGFVSDQSVFAQTFEGDNVTLSVDKEYLRSLPDEAFPAVIDPVVFDSNFGTREGGSYVSFKSDGYICPSHVCNPYAGSLYDSNWTLRWWRGAIYAPYDQFKDSNNTLTNATLHLVQRSNESFWTGDWGHAHSYRVGHAHCLNSFHCVNSYSSEGYFDSGGDINVTSLYQSRISANDFGAWLMIMGEDDYDTDHTFKNIDPNKSYVKFTYGGPPPAPSIATPTANQVYVDPQASFKVNHVDNPNGGTPLQYEFLVSTGPGGAGGVIVSGKSGSKQWTAPDGVLQDGTTYYIQARTYDPITQDYSNGWGTSVPFRIDMRTGKDKTQTYDNFGPVDIDLATGNLTTSTSSHSSAATGGALGVSLDYNSPIKSRNGLVGEYWNVPENYSGGVPSGTPNMTRVDQNVDFDWDTGSPAGGVASNWFFTRWKGYFVAPKEGTYYFGSRMDDVMTIHVDGNYINNMPSTPCYTTVCYGTSVTLEEGQIVPFEARYREATSSAYAHLWVKGAVDEQIVPSEWLQTDVRPVANKHGLTGRYYGRFDGTNTFSSANGMVMQRTDPYLSFNWKDGAPVTNGPSDFLVRWTGYITVPVSGNYTFGSRSDDGTKITVGTNNTVVLNDWTAHGPPQTPIWGGNTYMLSANTPVPVTIEYFDQAGAASFEFWMKSNDVSERIVPTDWLSPNAQVLPDGWSLGLDASGGLSYDHITANQNSAVLTDSTGATHEYTWTGSGYKPPVNEDGQLVRNGDGTHTLQDIDGRTYLFAADGTLSSVTTPVDDRKPAALQYEYQSQNGGPPHLYRIKDGVDLSRMATVYYSGESDCGSSPSGFDTNAPVGMICAVKTNDGRATYFYYDEGQLARIAKPGDEMIDYQYEALTNPSNAVVGYRMVSVRNAAATDAIAAGIRSNDDSTNTTIDYDILGRAVTTEQPAATAGGNRIEHTIEYLPGAKAYVDQNGAIVPGYRGMTKQHVTGATETHGFTRRIKYDNLFRTIEDTDITNLSQKMEWDETKDLALSATDKTGIKTTTIYDDEDRPIESYGPAPEAWFGADRKPTSTYLSQVPRSESNYDEGIVGPSVAWLDYKKQTGNANGILSGAPKLHTTGINISAPGTFLNDFTSPPITASSGAQGIGVSTTGKLRLPNGTYNIAADSADGVRVWVDDILVLDRWIDTGVTTTVSNDFTVTSSAPKRVRVDAYRRTGVSGMLQLRIRQQGGFTWTNDWSSYLKPGYSLTTSSKTYDSTVGDVTATTDYGTNPELGLPQSSTLDPTGLNLSSSNTYEEPGATGSFLRQTSKTMPGGNTTNYSYYTSGEVRDNPCTQGTETFNQAGFMKFKTEPGAGTSGGGGGGGSSTTPAVQSSTSGSVGSGALTLNKPSGTVDGDLLIMTASADLSESEDVTYTVDSGWTELIPLKRSHATNTGTNMQAWYKLASSEPSSYSITPDHSNLIAGSIVRIDGQAASNFIHQSAFTTSDSGEASAPSVTTTVDNALVMRLATWDQSKSIVTAPSGHGQTYHVDVSGHDNWGGYKEQTTAGSTGVAQFDLSSGSPHVGFTIAVAPQDSGQGGGGSSPGDRVTETVYDDAGRVVASRMNDDDWSCITYDVRGRVVETTVPTINSRPGRTVTTNYDYQNSPLKTQVIDSVAGTGVSEVDLLGRAVSSTDAFGNTSTVTYDNLGRVTTKTSPLGTESYVYDDYSRATQQKLDGTTYATVTYDTYSRVQDITYNQAQDGSSQSSTAAPQVKASTTNSTGSGGLTLNKPTGTVNGDLLIMTASADLSASEDVTYTIPSGWTSLQPLTRSDTSGAGNNLQTWYKIADNEPTNYTVTPDHDNLIGGSIVRIDGHDVTNPIDTSNVTASASGEAAAPSVTTTVDDALVLRLATWDQSKSLNAIPSGHTQAYHLDVSGHDSWGGHKEQAAAGSTGTAQLDLSSGSPYVGSTIAIKPAGSGSQSNDTLKLEQIKRDDLQRASGAVFRFSDGTAFDETVVRTQSGKVASYTDTFGSNSVTSTYAYDKASRLLEAVVDQNKYTYNYGAPSSGTCSQPEANLNAHKNSNRTSYTHTNMATSQVVSSATYCYDQADRLLSTSDVQVGTPTYDDHGNTTSISGNGSAIEFAYDALDQNTRIEQGTHKVEYVKTSSGAVLRKKEYENNTLTKSYRYIAGGAVLQTCSLTNDNDCTTVDKYIGLVGGVSLTLSPDNPDPDKRTVYSITNFHGDTAITADENGAPTSSVYLYEPFGQAAPSTTFGTNSDPSNATDQPMGWASSPTRKVAGTFTTAIIQMGARVYLPSTARFLQTDPIDGGTPNDYVYPPDPINSSDYSGLWELKVGNANCNCSLSVTRYYGAGQSNGGGNVQSSAAAMHHLQPAASAATVNRVYSPSFQINVYRPSVRYDPPKPAAPVKTRTWIQKVGRAAGGAVSKVKKGVSSAWNNGYVNVNVGVTTPRLVGINGGVKKSKEGANLYGGICLSRPGVSGSVTASPSAASEGWSGDLSFFSPKFIGGSLSTDGSIEAGVGMVGGSLCVNYTW